MPRIPDSVISIFMFSWSNHKQVITGLLMLVRPQHYALPLKQQTVFACVPDHLYKTEAVHLDWKN